MIKYKNNRTTKWITLSGAALLLASASSQAQVSSKGLSPPANTYSSYQDASIARDSRINQPLELLNDFYPAIEVTISGHDNVRRRPSGAEDDLLMVISPSLGYRTDIGRHKFYAAYTGTFTSHDEFEQEDARANGLTASLGLDISRRFDVDLFGSLGDTFEKRGVSGTRPFDAQFDGVLDDGPDRIEYESYGADLVYGRKLDLLVAVLGFEHSETEFRTDQGDSSVFAGSRDREADSIHLDIDYRIGGKTSLFGRIQKTEIDYQRSFNSLDSEQTDYLFGVRWRPSNALSGAVGVGRTDRDFEDNQRQGFDGSNYYVNLSYMINPFSVISLAASRAIEEPGDVDASFYESELFGIGWDHSLTDHLQFNAYAKWIDDDYDIDREDKFFDWGLGLDYAWRQWLTLGVYYGEIERDSNRFGVDYDDAYFGLRLRSDLRPLLRSRGQKHIEPYSYPSLKKTQAVQ